MNRSSRKVEEGILDEFYDLLQQIETILALIDECREREDAKSLIIVASLGGNVVREARTTLARLGESSCPDQVVREMARDLDSLLEG